MRAELRGLDISGDLLEGFIPDNSNDFYFEVTATIGPEGDKGTNYFMITVCTENKIDDLAKLNGPSENHGMIVVDKFNADDIRFKIERIIESCGAESWVKIVINLRKHFRWEYDGYASCE